MKKHFLFMLFFLSAISITFAGQKKIQFTEYTLDNGLHVILHQDNTAPIVAIGITYHVGSKNEVADRTGFAHYMEHLMFEGSKNIGRGDFFKLAQDAGGEINAYTSQDKTFYHMLLPSNQLEMGLWMESERLLHLVIDEEGVETQRKVIKEERSQMYDNRPYGSIMEETFKRAFSVHPYNWLPIGSVQYIDQATLEEFIDFHSTFYVPNNAVLSIAGDININETKKLIELYFGDIPKGTKPVYRPEVVEPPLSAEVRDIIYDPNIQLPAIIQAYRIPGISHDDFYALDMLTTLLSSGQSSRMHKSIVDEQQKALFMQSMPFPLEDPGLFLVLGIVNMGVTTEELETAIDAEIIKVQNEGLTDLELQKLKNNKESTAVFSYASLERLVDNLANYHIFHGDANMINTEIDKYMAVTKDDIIRVAKKYLSPENRVVLYYSPKK
jgi:zinc protease